MQKTDRQLIESTLAGRRDAFEQLLERHGPVLWAAVRRQMGDSEEARDLYQDAVVRGYEQLGRVREPERLRSWWLSIALNLVRSHARRPRPILGDELALADRPAEDPVVGQALEDAEQVERLRTELDRLPPRQREVCRLRLVDGLSHNAIAELLGITPEASRANTHQAVRRLRELLA